MNRFCLLIGLLVLPNCKAMASETSTSTVLDSSSTADIPEQDPTTSTQESESKGIIPYDADTLVSTTPITPTSVFPEKSPYDQGREELIRAMNLWAAGHSEAASDTALEAYDDLIELRRIPGVKRAQIRAQVHQAAVIYVEAGIAYIRAFVRRLGSSPEAIEEGRGRLEDLGDVAHNYKDLNKMLHSAMDTLGNPVKPVLAPKQTPTPPVVNVSTPPVVKISTNSPATVPTAPISTSTTKNPL